MGLVKNQFRLICFGVMLVLGLSLSIYQSVIGDITEIFDSEGMFSGVLLVLYFMGALILPAASGAISDWIGKKNLMLIGGMCMVCGVVMVALSRHVALVGAGMFLTGGGSSTVEGLLSAKISDDYPHIAEKLMNYSQMFFCIGAVSGPLLVIAVRALGGGWQINMFVVAAFLMLATAFLAKIQKDGKDTHHKEKHEIKHSTALFKDIRFLMFFLAMLLYVGAEGGMAFFIVRYFQSIDVAVLGEISLSMFWGAMILGRFLSGRLHEYSDQILIFSVASAVVFSLVLQWVDLPMVSALIFFLLGLCMAAVWPLIMAHCTRMFSNVSGTAGGLMMTAGALGGIIMPALMSAMADRGGIRGSFPAVTGAMLITLVIVICLQYIKRRAGKKSI